TRARAIEAQIRSVAWGTARPCAPGGGRGPEQKSPPRPEPGGPGRLGPMLLVDSIGSLAALRFEGLDGVSRLLHRAGHEPANCVFLPAHLVHDLSQRGAVLPLEHGDHLGRLAAFARAVAFRC